MSSRISKSANKNTNKIFSYGLLGPSGCGKTVLISCILGIKKLDSGRVETFGGSAASRRIGFMPQEVALITNFSIKENIYYFATLNGMKKINIDERFNFFKSFLELPDVNTRIKDCSEGQKRSVSFIACVIHNPELLILDEPTVGLDVMLREKMWKFLEGIVKSNKTSIIITTHYIEEAKYANCVCFMYSIRTFKFNQI